MAFLAENTSFEEGLSYSNAQECESIIIIDPYGIPVHNDGWLSCNYFPSTGPGQAINVLKPTPWDRDVELQKHQWLAESPVDSWNKIELSEEKVFCPSFLNLEKLSCGSQESWLKDLNSSQMPLLKELREQWYLIRKNFKILNIVSNGADSWKLAVSEHFWCPPCPPPWGHLPAVLGARLPGLRVSRTRRLWPSGSVRGQRRPSRFRTLQSGYKLGCLRVGGRTPWPPVICGPRVCAVPPSHVILRAPLGFLGSGTVGGDVWCATSCLPMRLGEGRSLCLSIPMGIEAFIWCLIQAGHFTCSNLHPHEVMSWLLKFSH